MALPDFRGKTKKDLSAIAHISGLLTPSDTSRMTKQQLIDFLTRMAEESELAIDGAAAPEAVEPEPVKAEPKKVEPEEKPEDVKPK